MTYRTTPESLVILASHGQIAARERTSGNVVWRASLAEKAGHRDSPATLITRVFLTSGKVFVYGVTEVSAGLFSAMEHVHTAMALDALSGEVMWRTRLCNTHERIGSMLVDRDIVVLTSGSYTVALDVADGTVRWKQEHTTRAYQMAIAVDGHAVQADGVGRE